MLHAIALNSPFFKMHRIMRPYVLKADFCTDPDSKGPSVEEWRDYYSIGRFLTLLAGAGTIRLTEVTTHEVGRNL